MDFEKVFNEVLGYFPEKIAISDGKLIPETNGFKSTNLASMYDNAEDVAALSGEWQSLMVWVIYQLLHEAAIAQFSRHEFILERRIDKERFKEHLMNNLREEGYESMYDEFLEYEKKLA